MVVIGGVLFPQKILAWGQGKAEGWKRPFVVKVQHPVWGAEMAQAAGSSERVVNLIRRHQDPLPSKPSLVEDELLCLLQWADDQN